MNKIFILFVNMVVSHTNLYSDNYGRLFLEGNCITCHHKTKSISAPSLQIIKSRYYSAFRDKQTFVSYMTNWVYKPSIDGTIMIDMIKKYELMPELGYDKDTLKKIATYIYETEF